MIIPRQKRFSVLEGIGEVVKRDLSSKNLISNPFISYPPGYFGYTYYNLHHRTTRMEE